MRILVANLGSTSLKGQLFDASGDGLVSLARAGYERVTDYRAAILGMLEDLREGGHIADAGEIAAVGFKTVLGHQLSGCVPADERCLKALEEATSLAPAHNPPYATGIRLFQELLPEATLVALFETAFYQWVPEASRQYAVPKAWREAGVVRHGFHGASHKFIGERSAELLGRDDIAERVRQLYHGGGQEAPERKPLRVVSCHLGGSSSVTGIRNGIAIGTSMGLSPQSGLPQNNRVGELDSMAIPYVMKTLGLDLATVERQLTKESGLLGLSGVSNDVRDIREAAATGNADAQLAVDHLVAQIRHWTGAFAFQMGGLDALVFTAGIGENDAPLRAAVTAGLEDLGIVLDPARNEAPEKGERRLSTDESRVQVWVIPANEEAVVARETHRFLQRHKSSS
ncbi:MAG: acetate/propionate family kinase [Opitutales bacterium]